MPDRVAGKFGRRPNDPSKPRLHLSRYVGAPLPAPPATVDWVTAVTDWPMYLNDELGDCTCACVGHMVEVFTRYGAGTTVEVTDDDVLKLYELQGYRPDDPSTDQGAVIQDVLGDWRKTGIAGHKVVAFASVDVSNPAEVKQALNLFGSVDIGFNVPASAMDQFNAGKPWDVVTHDGGIEGGHCVPVQLVQDSSPAYKVVTWGAVQEMTQAFWDKYVEEAWVVITEDFLNGQGVDPQGFDLYQLGEDLAALTGEPNPIPAPPNPTPPPTPGPTPDPGAAPFPGASVAITRHIVASAHRARLSVPDWMNRHFTNYFG